MVSISQLNQLMMMYFTQANQTTSYANKNEGSPFDTTTNEGWGANAYLNKNNSLFSYTKTTTTGNTFTGSNDKKLSIDSALAFSEMSLKSADGKVGDSDGKVSIAEFNKGSGGTIGTILDVDKDGFIGRSELTSYYMLIDKLDGNQDGKVNSGSGTLFKLLSTMAPDTIKGMLQSNIDKIKDADVAFNLEMPKIDGSKGPYDNTNQLGNYANNGYENPRLGKTGKNVFCDCEYAAKESKTHPERLNIATGLASSKAWQERQDRNGDGKISVLEARLSGDRTLDIDKDGFISAGESLADAMVEDKNNDGKITYSERLAYQNIDSDDYKTAIKQKYADNKIADAEKTFEMPEKTATTSTDNSSKIQQLFKLILQMFGYSI